MSGALTAFMALGGPGVTMSAQWGDITVSSPSSTGSNSDVTLTYAGGGSRTITVSGATAHPAEYRIAAGSWVSYAGGFSHTSGQTLAWRYTVDSDNVEPNTVYVNGVAIDSFVVSGLGFGVIE